MNFSENLKNAKNFAIETALAAKDKATQLAAIAKANIAIYAEEDKIKKAQQQLGQLYYRDYAVGEEMDSAEYLPWCSKIDESNAIIAELRDRIAELRARDAAVDAAEEAVEEMAEAEEETAPAEEEAAPAEEPAEEAPAEAEIEIHIEPKADEE